MIRQLAMIFIRGLAKILRDGGFRCRETSRVRRKRSQERRRSGAGRQPIVLVIRGGCRPEAGTGSRESRITCVAMTGGSACDPWFSRSRRARCARPPLTNPRRYVCVVVPRFARIPPDLSSPVQHLLISYPPVQPSYPPSKSPVLPSRKRNWIQPAGVQLDPSQIRNNSRDLGRMVVPW